MEFTIHNRAQTQRHPAVKIFEADGEYETLVTFYLLLFFFFFWHNEIWACGFQNAWFVLAREMFAHTIRKRKSKNFSQF